MKPIQAALCDLINAYTSDPPDWTDQRVLAFRAMNKKTCTVDVRALDPRPLFTAVQQNAMFGQYDDSTMEDAGALLMDIMGGLDDTLTRDLFTIRSEETIICRHCDPTGAGGKGGGDEGGEGKGESGEGAGGGGRETWRTSPPETTMTVVVGGEEEEEGAGGDGKADGKEGEGGESGGGESGGGHASRLLALMHCHKLGWKPGMGSGAGSVLAPVSVNELVSQQFAPVELSDYLCEECGKVRAVCTMGMSGGRG